MKSGFDEELEQKEKRELALNDKLKKIAASADKIKNKMDILEQYKNIDHLDRVIIDNLIDYIEIGRSEKKIHKNDLPPINIHWKF